MQILHEDHINVARLLDVIDHVMDQIRQGNVESLQLACNAMRYMTAYPDMYHHPTEDAVFARLVQRAPETRPVIEQLSAEHKVIGETGTVFLKTLGDSVQQPAEPARLLQLGPAYIDQLREHMNIEEGDVFPIIKVVLSNHDWGLLEETLASAVDPLFGPQIQKGYQDLARVLSDTLSKISK